MSLYYFSQDRNKRTPLHWASSQGCHEYAKLLLKHGASVEVTDVEGKTALHWAASSGGAAAARAKLRGGGGGNAAAAMPKGVDPAKTVKLLVEAAPNVLNWQDYEGRLALHLGEH